MGNSDSSVHPLTRAVIDGDLTRLQKLLSKTENWADVKDRNGYGLLHSAAWKNRVEVAEYLTANGINIELRNDMGKTPFLVACQSGSVALVDLLISKRCNRLAETTLGRGALALAVIARQFEMTKKLVEMGFDVNKACDKAGCTSLHWAAAKGSAQIVTFLIDNGANLEAKTKLGSTPIMIAVCCHDDIDFLRLLISKGCDVLTKDGSGRGLLHCAAAKNRLKVAEHLIDNGINIELQNNWGETPFLLACANGSAALVDLLISKGCNRLAESKLGRGALALAIIAGQFQMTKKLVEMGFDVNQPCGEVGYTLLHWAVSKGSNQIVNFLIDKGAHLEAETKTGRTPIMIAVKKGNVELLDLLISKGCDVRAKDKCGHGLLVAAVWGEKVHMFKTVLKMGFDLNETCSNGRTCLHWAAVYDSASIAEILLEQGANLEPRAKRGRTPFLFAVAWGSNNVASLLSTKGCDIHAKDEAGRGALVLACTNHQYDTIPLLLSKFDYLNEEGAPMLHWAARNDYQRMAALLISHGVDLEAKDEWGCTPFLTAVEFGSDNSIDLLILKKCNIFATTRDGASALDLAIMGGRLDLFRRFVNAGVAVDDLTQETREFLAKLVADGNEEASKYMREVDAPLHVIQEKDVVLSEPESKLDEPRNDFSSALAPENDIVEAVDGGETEETASESLSRAKNLVDCLSIN
ncbi:putative ankyrin repeat protein RF_0381 [Oscarella lobularis]|uniref:putative ankyrin repeat protein RF_0381 n=1 Tax=Oscarella lobularis TaxID=121494 RepID=UPI00331343C2